jgi:hypothetical protein
LKIKCSQKGFASNSDDKVDTMNDGSDLHDEAQLETHLKMQQYDEEGLHLMKTALNNSSASCLIIEGEGVCVV